MSDHELRPGRPGDVRETFELSDQAMRSGVDHPPDQIEADWQRWRGLVEFVAGQPGGACWVAEDAEGIAGYTRMVGFEEMEVVTELVVTPRAQGRGLARELLERCWPGVPTPKVGRAALAMGLGADLSLYTTFACMPIAGHWAMVASTERYRERRSQETDATEASVVALAVDKAVAEWKRLEPEAIGHQRPELHEFFAREHTCLATLAEDGRANALCWVSPDGGVGPGVAETTELLPTVVLQALDRVARSQEPEELTVFCTTISWWLLRRLRSYGFRVRGPNWIMCSKPLPGLDRYLPTYPAYLL